jgi:O-antigen/teichoic acid export membrane protein
VLLGEELVARLFGGTYQASALIAAILCTGRLVQSLTGLNEMVLAMTGGERILSVVLIVCSGLTASLCWLGFKIGGPPGVALASSLVMALQGLYLAFASRRRLGFWPGCGRLA